TKPSCAPPRPPCTRRRSSCTNSSRSAQPPPSPRPEKASTPPSSSPKRNWRPMSKPPRPAWRPTANPSPTRSRKPSSGGTPHETLRHCRRSLRPRLHPPPCPGPGARSRPKERRRLRRQARARPQVGQFPAPRRPLGILHRQERRTVFRRPLRRYPQGHGRIPPPAGAGRSQGRRRGSPPRQPGEGHRRPPRPERNRGPGRDRAHGAAHRRRNRQDSGPRRTRNRFRRQGRPHGVETLFRRTRYGTGRTEGPRPHDARRRRRAGPRICAGSQMTLSAVATRYAKALADVTSAPAGALSPQDALTQLRAFESALAASRELENALTTPAVPTGRKRAVVGRIAGVLQLSPIARNFLFVL